MNWSRLREILDYETGILFGQTIEEIELAVMKYVSEYRDAVLVNNVMDEIRRTVTKPWTGHRNSYWCMAAITSASTPGQPTS